MADQDEAPKVDLNEGQELFEDLDALPFVELDVESSRVLRGIIRGQVMRQALANVLKITKMEAISLMGLNLLSEQRDLQEALRKQGQVKGLILAIENLIEQAYAWQEKESENGRQEDSNNS